MSLIRDPLLVRRDFARADADAFLRSERALVTLWPHLGMSAASEMVEHVIDGAD